MRLTRSAAAGVERPSIELKAIDLDGATAHVRVLTHASGQAEVSDELVLRREARPLAGRLAGRRLAASSRLGRVRADSYPAAAWARAHSWR